ncbi:MAG: hypothetical protein B7X06_00965 [Verrucomicrobia bacterium 21-51-4]|nr:MAG: hypothetical protein B7X06_00965 [Verrucomicrobia bacterium 21-51-4]
MQKLHVFELGQAVFAHIPRLAIEPVPVYPRIQGLDWDETINALEAWRNTLPAAYAVHELIRLGDLPGVRWLAGMGADLQAANEAGDGPAVVAIEEGQLGSFLLLLELRVPVESLSRKMTLLMFAAWHNRGEMIIELLRRGANVHAATEDRQETALQFAVRGRHQEAVRILTAHGADPEAATAGDIPGITAIDRARGDAPLLQLLEEARARKRDRLSAGVPLDVQALAGLGINDVGCR